MAKRNEEAEIIDAEVIEADSGKVDALAVIAFGASLLIVFYPFNALVGIVLGAVARRSRHHSPHVGFGLALAAVLIGLSELLIGVLLVVLALTAAQARATGREVPAQRPTSSELCAQHPLHCAAVRDDAVAGARTYVNTLGELAHDLLG